MTPTTRARLEADFERSAREYQAKLTLEHYMEATPQATQREIFLFAFAMIHARRPDVHRFNELLVQYDHGRPPQRRGVVPDNMVVIHDDPIEATGSYAIALQPARPFFVLEYVSNSSKRKDYEDSFQKYERELKVPYYLIFYPDGEEMTLFRRGSRRYAAVVPGAEGRCPIPELEAEVGLLDGWVRFWFRGELLPLPDEVQGRLDEKDRQLSERDRQLAESEREKQELRRQLAAALRARNGHA